MLSGCKQTEFKNNPSSNDISSDTLYSDFLSQKTDAVDKNGNSISLKTYLESNSENKYAIYDMNGDDNPELLIKTPNKLDIYWIKNNKVTLWYEGTGYTKPLNNMALLSERKGGAPEHTDYIYCLLGYQGGEIFKIEFSKYSATQLNGVQYDEIYLVDNTEVTEEIYNSITQPLLSVNDNKIIWKELQ